jgi:hypothetical protein
VLSVWQSVPLALCGLCSSGMTLVLWQRGCVLLPGIPVAHPVFPVPVCVPTDVETVRSQFSPHFGAGLLQGVVGTTCACTHGAADAAMFARAILPVL